MNATRFRRILGTLAVAAVVGLPTVTIVAPASADPYCWCWYEGHYSDQECWTCGSDGG